MLIWQFTTLMKYLQADPTADQERLVVLEWRLLPLARHNHFEPKRLHLELSQNPGFFAEVIAAIYCAKGEVQNEDKKPDELIQHRAKAADDLLESWLGIPGSKPDGTIDYSLLDNWVTEARTISIADRRVEVCDFKIGEQLSYAPSDPDGSWPCQAVRNVLESVKSDEILRGFITGVRNQRGGTHRGIKEGGDQERKLAMKFRAYAEKCKVAWPRTCLALRRTAERYETDAKLYDEQAEAHG
jgi:hypothetical protein